MKKNSYIHHLHTKVKTHIKRVANARIKKKHIAISLKIFFWFSIGVLLGLFFLISFLFIIFQRIYSNRAYPGISINNISVTGKSEKEIIDLFNKKNTTIQNTTFIFTLENITATISAKQLHLGYDSKLLGKQALTVGRASDTASNLMLIFQSYLYGTDLRPAYTYSPIQLEIKLSDIIQKGTIAPTNAEFNIQNNRVTTFKLSQNGQEIDLPTLENYIVNQIPFVVSQNKAQIIKIQVPIKAIKPKITSNDADTMGIKQLIGSGTSVFQHSIEGRIYNVELAASRINGVLIAPNETFSFDKALGDVTNLTGYKQAYVIQNGKTVLGDGGGVCQVSTTFFRAALNAGLPIIERHAHAYRVGYYEEDGEGPGLDATIFYPSVDLKVKNDTGHYILVQEILDPDTLRLTFNFYGTSDGRIANISKPVVTSQTQPPPDLYQDDPTLPKGTVKQTDFSAWGANVFFTRTVTRNGQTLISENYTTNYQPWQAIYLKGTQ